MDDAAPTLDEVLFQAQVGCLAVRATKIMILRVSYKNNEINDIACFKLGPPPIIQQNYRELEREAERQRGRMVKVGRPKSQKPR